MEKKKRGKAVRVSCHPALAISIHYWIRLQLKEAGGGDVDVKTCSDTPEGPLSPETIEHSGIQTSGNLGVHFEGHLERNHWAVVRNRNNFLSISFRYLFS